MLQSERRTVNLRYALAIPRGGMERGWKGGRTPGSTHQVIISPGPVSIARDFHLHRCVINEIIFGHRWGRRRALDEARSIGQVCSRSPFSVPLIAYDPETLEKSSVDDNLGQIAVGCITGYFFFFSSLFSLFYIETRYSNDFLFRRGKKKRKKARRFLTSTDGSKLGILKSEQTQGKGSSFSSM